MSGDLNAIESLVQAETRIHGNSCATCEWLASLKMKERQMWHDVMWDGREADGQLRRNKRWDTQAIIRAIAKVTPEDFPPSSPDGHRKHRHETPGIEA